MSGSHQGSVPVLGVFRATSQSQQGTDTGGWAGASLHVKNPAEDWTVQSPSPTPPWGLQGSRKLLLGQDNGLLRGEGRWVQMSWFSSRIFSLKPSISIASFNVPACTKKSFSLVHRGPQSGHQCPADGQGQPCCTSSNSPPDFWLTPLNVRIQPSSCLYYKARMWFYFMLSLIWCHCGVPTPPYPH